MFEKNHLPAHCEIACQFDSTALAYNAVVGQLRNRLLMRKLRVADTDTLRRQFEHQQMIWSTNGAHDFVDTAQQQSVGYTLVATPNIPVRGKQLRGLAETLLASLTAKRGYGGVEPAPCIALDEALFEQYSPHELSGDIGEDAVRFSLISDTLLGFSGDGILGTPSEIPELNLHTPSVLEAMTLWYVRNELGVLGTDGLRQFSRYRYGDTDGVHHIDLDPRPNAFGEPMQPWTYLGPLDQPTLVGFSPEYPAPSRYAIG